jgi:ATP-dependent Clp protease protease subunit
MIKDITDGYEFRKYAIKHRGISSNVFDSAITGMTPYIIEERSLNVAQMDVFSRLMMDRIIFLGTGIDDHIANIIQAQLLFLESADNKKDIQIYLNSPGGSVYAGLGIYDTMQYIAPDVATICTGMAASMGAVLLCAGAAGKTHCVEAQPCDDSSTLGRRSGTGFRHRNHCPRDCQAEEGVVRHHCNALQPDLRESLGR